MKFKRVRAVAACVTKPLLSFLLLSSLLCACQQKARVAAGNDITGVYTLVSVAGNKVPASISHDGTALRVQSGSFTVAADGTCSTKTTFVPPSGAEATRNVLATYTKEGSKLTMKWQGAGMTTATVEGGNLTMNNEGMMFVYAK
jgi:hypothetical protein